MANSASSLDVNQKLRASLTDLPVECLKQILTGTDLKTTSLVSRLFNEIVRDPIDIFIQLKNPLTSSACKRLISASSCFYGTAVEKTEWIFAELLKERAILRLSTPDESFLLAARPRIDLMKKLAEESRDQNLILFFQVVGRYAGLGEFTRERFDRLPLKERAALCRGWIEKKRNLLAHISALDLSKTGLTSIPEELGYFTGLTEIDLSGNCLGFLDGQLVDFLPNVTHLNLSCNKIRAIDPLFFSGSSTLSWLSLKRNEIKTLPPSFGTGLNGLERVDLSENQLAGIPAGFLPSSSKLLRLILSNNHCALLPDDFGKAWPRLNELSLAFNRLKSLPIRFLNDNLQLKVLFLQGNELAMLPQGFGENWPEIESLSLKINRLSALSPGFGVGMGQLKLLDLSYNALKVLPDSLSSLQSLELLHITQDVKVKISLDILLSLNNLRNKNTVVRRANPL